MTCRVFLLSVFLCLHNLSAAQTDSLASVRTDTSASIHRIQLHGYIKDMQTFYFADDPGTFTTGNLMHNRINTRFDIHDHLFARLEIRNRVFVGSFLQPSESDIPGRDDGYSDLSYTISGEDVSWIINIDRALLNWTKNKWEVTLGRQRINWGINLVWNPNDIFNAYNYLDFDYEERPGSDAVRFRYYLNSTSSFDLAWKIGDKNNPKAGALMYKTNFRTYDIQFLTGIHDQDAVIGAGWAGNVGKAGFKGEASYFHPYNDFADTTGDWSVSVSVDRSFKNGYFTVLSYLYSSASSGNLTGTYLLTGSLSPKDLMPFEHSFFAQVSKQLNLIFTVNCGLIYAPEPVSLVFLPTLTVSIANNWELALIDQTYFAKITDKMKLAGNGIFLRLRWSF